MELNKLSPEEKRVIINKGTEPAFTGKFENFFEKGTFICRQCASALYTSESKFHSGCGWPSFDQEIEGRVKRQPDSDGRRTEIVCSKCGGHLGHVFEGEGLTSKNTRHCVNSLSLDFIPSQKEKPTTDFAVLGGGCFWCLEAVFSQLKGITEVEPGYAGGYSKNPTYNEVCSGNTGHAEVLKIEFYPAVISYELLLDIFFSIHNPTTLNRQGNDVGEQYRSIILFNSPEQENIARKAIANLENSKTFLEPIITEVKPLGTFYKAEDYHREYFFKNPYQPYCTAVVSPKVEKFRKKFKDLLNTSNN
jgi:peptide methionine sulfoxide reductase msrA/msrB